MTAHNLTPLLAPRSIAIVGASSRANSPGNDAIHLARRGGFQGRLYPINAKYTSLEGLECYASVRSLPEPVDVVVLLVSNARLEAALEEAVECGARSAVILGTGHLQNDGDPPLTARLTAIARKAQMPICGGNCMGFYHDAARVWIGGYPSSRELRPGGITLVANSGSVFQALTHNDPRLRFNLAISAGQELVTGVADYLDFALEQPTTRVAGLFLETVRDPRNFIAALEKAAVRDIPVVALKVGRTEASAALAVSHSGAIAGNDAAYEALFDRYGVIRVSTIDEMACTLMMFDGGRRASAGGLASVHDSGGERELVVDLAHDLAVPFSQIGPPTVNRLREWLEPGLDPINPLDAWGTGKDFVPATVECFVALLEDPNTAAGIFFYDLSDDFYVSESVAEICRLAAARTNKPVALATNYTQVRHDATALSLSEAGVPVLDGSIPALLAIKHLLEYRDFRTRAVDTLPAIAIPDTVTDMLREPRRALQEATALTLLKAYGIESPPFATVSSADEAVAAAHRIGFPVVAKTATPGVFHKTDVAGVKLRLNTPGAVADAYSDLAARLGPQVLIMGTAPAGVELALGLLRDPQFGPVVMVGAGGTLVEILRDVRFGLAPFGVATARRLIAGLRVRSLLEGVRGMAPVNIESVAETVARFSLLARDIQDLVSELDVNPLIVSAHGALAVDALIIASEAITRANVCDIDEMKEKYV
jgi:acetate---CoA ligase (ADP-forming)